MELTARVRIEDGTYWADVEELPGCFAAGETLDELFESLREAIDLVREPGDPAGGSGSLWLTTAVLSDTPSVLA